jgi:TetR/AcrR family transcriptional repressor of nem operon
MRRSKDDATETRKKIVTTAATAFREHGFKGIGVSDLMSAAGLTHGGFYRHFQSKDELVAEACNTAITQRIEVLRAEIKRQPATALKRLVSRYLSFEHRDHPETGCVLAGLGSEIARADAVTREAAQNGYLALVELISELLKDQAKESDHRDNRSQAAAIASSMIGALLLSRMVPDRKLSNKILRDTTEQILTACAAR